MDIALGTITDVTTEGITTCLMKDAIDKIIEGETKIQTEVKVGIDPEIIAMTALEVDRSRGRDGWVQTRSRTLSDD